MHKNIFMIVKTFIFKVIWINEDLCPLIPDGYTCSAQVNIGKCQERSYLKNVYVSHVRVYIKYEI